MRASLSAYSLDFKLFSLIYKPIRKKKEENLYETTLYKNQKNKTLVQIKEQTVFSQKDLSELLSGLEDLLPLNKKPFFIRFLGFSIKKSHDHWTVYMIYEYFPLDLEKEFKKGLFIEETLLWSLLHDVLKALQVLKQLNRSFGDIKLSRIWRSDDNKYKVFYTNYHLSSLEKVLKTEITYYKYNIRLFFSFY